MSHDEQPTLRRRKPGIARYLAIVFLLLLALFAYQTFGPNPPIVVLPSTTFITAPLRADGLPDYARYVNDRYAANVTTEENAAVLLWQAIEAQELSSADVPLMLQAMGMAAAPTDSNRLVLYDETLSKDLWEWYCDKFDIDDPRWAEDIPDQIIAAAQTHPWKSNDAPLLSRWLDSHQTQIDLILEASQRPKYYMPAPE